MSDPLQIHPAVARGKLQEYMWDDPNYIAEEKLDGVRYLWHIHDGHSHFTSRRISSKTGMLVQKDEHFPHISNLRCKLPPGTIFDGEMMPPNGRRGKSYDVTKITGSLPETAIWLQEQFGWLSYNAFDILHLSFSLTGLPFYQRREKLELAVNSLLDGGESIRYLPQEKGLKKAFLHRVWDEGGEGVILKNTSAVYGDRQAWVKVKPTLTYDVVITGFQEASLMSEKVGGEMSPTKFAERGWIGAVVYGQWKNDKLIELGTVSGFDDATRAIISGERMMYVGKVMELAAQERLPSGSLRHPRFIRFRDDKNPHDCLMEE